MLSTEVLDAAAERHPTGVDRAVGINIRRIRKAAGRSQEWLAEKIGLTFQQLQKYESATNRVSASKLMAICEALECSPLDILPPMSGANRADLPPTLIDLAQDVYGLCPDLIPALSGLTAYQLGSLLNLAQVLATTGQSVQMQGRA